jgi:hypothetical protein
METIIGRFLTPLNSLRTMGERPSRRDDNSRGEVQNVRGDSSEFSTGLVASVLVFFVLLPIGVIDAASQNRYRRSR